MRKAILLLLLLFCALKSYAQNSYTYAPGQSVYPGYQQWQVANSLLPTTPTLVTGYASSVTAIGVTLRSIVCNNGATADAITIVDAVSGTPVWRSVAIAAYTAYSFDFRGETVMGGVKWSSSAGSVVCWLQGGY